MEVLQWIAGGLAALGLSAAPWIAATLTGRLIPLSTVVEERKRSTERMVDKDAVIAALEKEKQYERDAKDAQAARADAAIEKLHVIATEFGATTVHLLQSLPKPEDVTS